MTAVVGSTLVGMVTGIPGANVAITGNFTIPLMKEAGYKPEQAGAIEAAASTGGQFMPPVMGAAAFIMSGLTGIPYIQIAIAAFVPALLYAVANGLYSHFQALKLNIAPLGIKADIRELVSTSPTFIVPFAVIIYFFLRGYSPAFVAFWAVVTTLILTVIVKPRPSVNELFGGFSRGAIMGAQIGIACASIGIIVRVVEMTGLGVKLGSIIGTLSGGIPILALIFTAGAALVLGTGVPTTPAYILVGMIAAPVLVNMGYSLMQSHLFVLYFACMSMVTLPVAPAAVVAAKLSGTTFLKTAAECVKPAAAGWLIPFVFMWVPLLILQPGELAWFQGLAILGFITTLLSLEVGMVNHYFLPCTLIERVIALSTLPVLFLGIYRESYLVLGAAIALFAILTISQLRRRERPELATPESSSG
jgi:TRAP transporter 4TM/12TM fusion protein